MGKKHQSVRIFRSPYLEKLTHVHPALPLLLWAPVIGVLIYRSLAVHGLSPARVIVVGLAGFLTWTLAEYFLHRWVFHFPARKPWQKRLVFLFHGLHHDDPQDPTRLVMPPVPAIFFATGFYWFFRALLGPAAAEPYFALFLTGYLCYDYIHYGVHHFTPKSRVGKYLKQYHMLHHFTDNESRWGVSSPLWDWVFGTAGRRPR